MLENYFYIILFIFWSIFWSFASVLIYRLKSKERWIFAWRSHCNKCNHKLWALELIPFLSWIKNFWRCKYCKEKVSIIYPLLELSTWVLFFLIWYFLIDFELIKNWNSNETIKLFFWLIIGFITIIYSFYDILFLEIHDWVMIVWIVISLIAIILESLGVINIFPYLSIGNTDIVLNIVSIIILIYSIWLLYIIMFKELQIKYDFLILILIWTIIYFFLRWTNSSIEDFIAINSLVWVIIIFGFLFLQIAVSNGAWMWWWDLRIAILLWILVWYSFSIETLFLTYIVWSIISIFFIIYKKSKLWFKNKIETQVPFWPFLAIWFFLSIFIWLPLTSIILIYN